MLITNFKPIITCNTEAPDFSQHGGQVISDYTLSIENPNDKGAIYYTTDGTDPHISVVSPNETVLVPEKSPAHVYLQSEDTGMNLSWTALDFDESSWQAVQTGIGFERIAGDFSEFINYSILQMRGTNASCLIRIAFTIPDQETLDQISTLTLNMKYDDGYAAFINGHFAVGKNNPDPLLWNSRETIHSANDVGGWNNKGDMRMSVGVTYSSKSNEYIAYPEKKVEDLIKQLASADLVIGYNHISFDYPVLEGYHPFLLADKCISLDLMVSIEEKIGHRIKLESVASATLGAGKTAQGLDAIRWWREGKYREVAEYCCYDVKVTKLVHEFGAKNGYIKYDDKYGNLQSKKIFYYNDC